ncbi:MAG TPA: DHA2 family efflux MFS transporter permease subunit [Baekduia sp.]|nr:DHA2 family efflux MFS transporter permease subunit [Baekduia sp.]
MSTTAAPPPAGARATFDRHLIGVSIVVVLGTVMSILDTTIVNVAIDTLSREFDTGLATIQWVATGYMLALATVIPLTGWAADRFGTKRLYMISIGLFLAGSALAGAAWSAESLIVFRVLQGLGGGMIMPAGMTILSQAAGRDRIGRVMSVVGVPMLMGPVIGPVLGGWLVDDVSWRWIFYVNLPIGAIALLAALRFLPRDKPSPHERLDWLGLLLLSPGLAAFVYGLAETASHGGIGSASALVPMLIGLALIGTFAWHALRSAWPLIDLRLMRHGTMTASSATTFLLAMGFFATMFLLPLYYQVVRGQPALHAGLLLAPQGLGAALMMPIAGKLSDRNGPGKVVLSGLCLLVIGIGLFTQVSADTSFWLMGATQFVLGLGMGSTMMPAMTAAYQSLEHQQIARATTALNIIQRVGASIGTALLSVVLSHELASQLGSRAGNGLAAAQGAPAAAREAVAPKIADAFGHTFWWSAAIVLLAFLPALMLPRTPPAPAAAPTGEAAGAEAEAPVLAEV